MRSLLCVALVAFLVLPLVSGCKKDKEGGGLISGKVTFKSANGPCLANAVTMTVHPANGAEIGVPLTPEGTFTASNIPAGEIKITFKLPNFGMGFGPGSMSEDRMTQAMKDQMERAKKDQAERLRTESGGTGDIPTVNKKYNDMSSTPVSFHIVEGTNPPLDIEVDP